MKNIFVEKMRNVLIAYNDQMKDRNAEIQKNCDTYSPQVAEEQNKIIRQKKEKDYEDACSLLEKIVSSIRESLARGNFPVSTEITDDRALFQGNDIVLTDAEVEILARKYRDDGNFTMLRLIETWANRNNRQDLKIYIPIDQLKAYLKIAKSARFTIDGIYSERKTHFIPLEVEHFGDPVMCAEEYEIIGDGKNLQELSQKKVPDEALHIFDDINI